MAYTEEQMRLMWTALKNEGSAAEAIRWLEKEHGFAIANPTILSYLKNGKLDTFGTPKEVEAVKARVTGRQGARYGRTRSPNGRTKVAVKTITEDQSAESAKRRKKDEKLLEAFSQERLSLLLEPAQKSLTGCKYPREDAPPKELASCSKHTMSELYGSVLSVPPSLRFGKHFLNYCPVHVYALLTTDGRRRLMDAVSSLSLALVA